MNSTTATFLPPAAAATAKIPSVAKGSSIAKTSSTAMTPSFLPPVDLLDDSHSSNSNLSSPLPDCSKANSINADGNPTGTHGTPWAELNVKDATQQLAKNLGTIGHGKLTKKMFVLSFIKAHNKEDICNKTSTTPCKSKNCLF